MLLHIAVGLLCRDNRFFGPTPLPLNFFASHHALMTAHLCLHGVVVVDHVCKLFVDLSSGGFGCFGAFPALFKASGGPPESLRGPPGTPGDLPPGLPTLVDAQKEREVQRLEGRKQGRHQQGARIQSRELSGRTKG